MISQFEDYPNTEGSVNRYYLEFYRKMIGLESTGLLSLLWKYPHRVMEHRFKSNKDLDLIEIGVGEGEHIQFVSDDYSKYVALDLDFHRLQKISEMKLEKISTIQGDAERLEFEDNYFDRLIATCLLVHLGKPEEALLEWRRVVKPGGALTIYIPCEPGILLKIFRNIFTKPKAKKLGFNGYDLFIARDHKSSADRVLNICRFVFRHDNLKFGFYPFRLRSWNLNLFIVVQVVKEF